MKIRLLAFIPYAIVLILLSGFKKSLPFSQKRAFSDSMETITVKAKFIKRACHEYCGFVNIPERNMFEIISFASGTMTKKIIEVEYYTGCIGSHFIKGETYFINASKYPGKSFYRNISTKVYRSADPQSP